MFEFLLKPRINLASAVLRLTLAAIFLLHGYSELVVGPYGNWWRDWWYQFVYIVAGIELAAGVALILGLLSRLVALVLAGMQVGAIVLVTGDEFIKFAMRRRQGTGPERETLELAVGFEFNVALIAMCLAVVLLGSGTLSLDHFFRTYKKKPTPAA